MGSHRRLLRRHERKPEDFLSSPSMGSDGRRSLPARILCWWAIRNTSGIRHRCAGCTGTISYAGYNEIFTGHTDAFSSPNLPIENPHVNVLEYQNASSEYHGKVAVFTSWNVFPYILNEARSGLPVNSGYTPLAEKGAEADMIEGPDIRPAGELKTPGQVYQRQLAATIAFWEILRRRGTRPDRPSICRPAAAGLRLTGLLPFLQGSRRPTGWRRGNSCPGMGE